MDASRSSFTKSTVPVGTADQIQTNDRSPQNQRKASPSCPIPECMKEGAAVEGLHEARSRRFWVATDPAAIEAVQLHCTKPFMRTGRIHPGDGLPQRPEMRVKLRPANAMLPTKISFHLSKSRGFASILTR
jgi:UDP-glucose 6-dehydrogenase